jgi:hypothetical protein
MTTKTSKFLCQPHSPICRTKVLTTERSLIVRNSPCKCLNSNLSVSSETFTSFEFLPFPTLPTNHTLSYMANPLHFCWVYKPRIARNWRCLDTNAALENNVREKSKCLAAHPPQFFRDKRESTHIRADISRTITASRTIAIRVCSYTYCLRFDVLACVIGSLPEFSSVHKCHSWPVEVQQ